MKFGSLFSGIGAIDLGLERAGMTCRWQVEIDEFANLVLEKHWPDVPRYHDVREVNGKKVEKVDLICGGFPCTDISVAGRGAGLEGVQSGLWYEMFRIVREMRPNWVLIENVSALRTRGADAVLDGLEAQGYSCWPFVVGGREVGAPHKRQRIFIIARLADANGSGFVELRRSVAALAKESTTQCDGTMADAQREGLEGQRAKPRKSKRSKLRHGGLSLVVDNSSSPRLEAGYVPPVESQSRSVVFGGGTRDVADSDIERSRRQWGSGIFDKEWSPFGDDSDRRNRWPSRPGEPQYEWEEPRVIKFEVGEPTDGNAKRLVRLARRQNKLSLKALGNSCIPQVIEAIGRSIMLIDFNIKN